MADDPLLHLIAGTLGIDPAEVNEDSGMSNTRKWDSLRQVTLMIELETRYGCEFNDQQMLETTSVAKIRALLILQGVA